MNKAEREDHYRRFVREAAAKYRELERCACGHVRSSHADTHAIGHGGCLGSDCDCQRFTWVRADNRVEEEARQRLEHAEAALAIAAEVEGDFEEG